MPESRGHAGSDVSAETTPVTSLSGIGPKVAERLARLGIGSVADALFHLPLRYQDRTRVVAIGRLRPGDEAVVEATIDHVELSYRRRRALLAHVSDGTGGLTLRWFHFSARQREQLQAGRRLRLYGEARRGPAGLEVVHPEYRLLPAEGEPPLEESLTPVYPATEGVGQATLRNVVGAALDWLGRTGGLVDHAGPAAPDDLPGLRAALVTVHRPPPDVDVSALMNATHPACRRLAFEELLAHHVSLRRLRQRAREHESPALPGSGDLTGALRTALPFRLTAAQERVSAEVSDDLARGHPMLRLVQGDVGSGKTIVAALAALQALESGFQAAVMAPTEVLAEQHFRNFSQWLEPLGVHVGWVTGRLTAAQRRRELAGVAEGRTGVVVGTHALFQESVEFAHLGLAIVDEQHRFGVHQRLALREKGTAGGLVPHQLIMTATPIPRTLAMTAYADLDTSVIDELPPGRTPVETVVVSAARRQEVVQRVAKACAEGRQAYWVCTLIEVSEAKAGQAAAETAEVLAEALPQLRTGLVHGRLKAREKESVMAALKDGDIDLLVATTVIEVGVDVPNASLMVIENAERLGLSQLHQLRGRVGRGSAASLCVLLYEPPLSENARARLATLRETSDGFRIAERDLELRGPGEVLGTRQTGLVGFRIADPVRDAPLLPQIRTGAERLLATDESAVTALTERWLSGGERYGDV